MLFMGCREESGVGKDDKEGRGVRLDRSNSIEKERGGEEGRGRKGHIATIVNG